MKIIQDISIEGISICQSPISACAKTKDPAHPKAITIIEDKKDKICLNVSFIVI